MSYMYDSSVAECETAETNRVEQDLDAPEKREQEVLDLYNYLGCLETDRFISPSTRAAAERAWGEITSDTAAQLPIPDASAGPGGMLLLTWERGTHYLELEFLPGERPTFFYLDQKTNEAWEVPYDEARNMRGGLPWERLHTVYPLFFPATRSRCGSAA